MKTLPDAVKAALAARNCSYVECHTITLTDGTILRYTTHQRDLTVARNIYFAGPLISGLKWSCKIGLDVNEQSIKVAYDANDTVNGQLWGVALRQGVFDGATWRWDRVFLDASGKPIADYLMPRGTFFVGQVKPGRIEASIRLRPPTALLNMEIPRNRWQPPCLNPLYGSACGVSRVVIGGNVQGGSSASVIHWSSASAKFAQGGILFTSGAYAGIRRTIKSASPNVIVLESSLDGAPAEGDAFQAWEGCDHTRERCAELGGRFRGFPFVPPPSTISTIAS